jgi:hypothetical protein
LFAKVELTQTGLRSSQRVPEKFLKTDHCSVVAIYDAAWVSSTQAQLTFLESKKHEAAPRHGIRGERKGTF